MAGGSQTEEALGVRSGPKSPESTTTTPPQLSHEAPVSARRRCRATLSKIAASSARGAAAKSARSAAHHLRLRRVCARTGATRRSWVARKSSPKSAPYGAVCTSQLRRSASGFMTAGDCCEVAETAGAVGGGAAAAAADGGGGPPPAAAAAGAAVSEVVDDDPAGVAAAAAGPAEATSTHAAWASAKSAVEKTNATASATKVGAWAAPARMRCTPFKTSAR
mmetsp:Transcript_17225/g.69309  ORF Transcript_17225/g.69309 Transcript_17225/m.69309 type:complete len:221 (+) Transcript_17225:69-731(+)